MNRNYGARVPIYRGPLGAPSPSRRSAKFVSCERIPSPPPPPRRTWYETFEDICYYISILCVAIFFLELLLQVVIYGYLQAPGGRSATTGRKLTHYDTLGVEYGADQEAVKIAWRQQSRAFHPDAVKEGNTEESRERYYWIQLAYVELSDPLARCYHDQYHGFLPRKWGQDDPCTKILMEREKESRESRVSAGASSDALRNAMIQKMEKDYGISLEWLKATKIERDEREWNRLRWWEKAVITLWEQLEYYGMQLVAWQVVVAGFIFALIERYWVYLVPIEKKYWHELRRRFDELIKGLVKMWEQG